MTAPSAPGTDLAARARLFAPGQRLGWIFRDRHQFTQPFTEPAPQPQPIPEHLLRAKEQACQRHSQRVRMTLITCAAVFIVFFMFSVYKEDKNLYEDAQWLQIAAIAIPTVIGGVFIGLSKLAQSAKMNAVTQAQQGLKAAYERDTCDWQQRKTEHEQAEKTRIDQLAEWNAVPTPTGSRRLDIFGGNLWAWQAFLTVYGTSALTARPVIVVDLSREMVCDELLRTAHAAGVPVDAQILPDQLADTTLLSGLPTRQIVDTLIESMYGDDPNAARAERSMDNRILTTLCEALGDNLSLGQIAGGLRALLDQPDTTGYLTTKERNHITDELFSTQYRQHAKDRLHRLESYIQPLETLGTKCVDHDRAHLTCIALASEGCNVRADLLTDIIVQWLTHRIVTQSTDTPKVIIAGADTIALRYLERLSDACERRNIHLTFLFRHLRDTAANFIGGGIAGFMKMSNNIEATHAADFIGRHHKFVISQITKTLGGNETHTNTDTYGQSETEGISVSDSAGWTKSWNQGSSTGDNHSKTRTESHNWSTTRNWSVSRAFAEGTNWSDAQTHQRVHEYTVDPTELQHLPDHAMILIKTQPGTQPDLVPVEFDPAIITLPRVSTDPHPELPIPTPQPTTLPTADTPTLTYHHTTQHQLHKPTSKLTTNNTSRKT